jgi:nitrogen fixation protein NifB
LAKTESGDIWQETCVLRVSKIRKIPMTETHPPLRVAVATKNKTQIDLHFGHADYFDVYDLNESGARFLEHREVEHYCQGGYGDEDKREVILRALADCAACFIARVGEGPREKLAGAGIQAVDAYPFGAVEASIMDWYRKQPETAHQ